MSGIRGGTAAHSDAHSAAQGFEWASSPVELVNCTPHPVHYVCEDKTITFMPSGSVPRVTERLTEVGAAAVAAPEGAAQAHEVRLVALSMEGGVEGLPEPAEGKAYIVSAMVAKALPGRKDLVSPGTSPETVIRDAKGAIVGTKAFVVNC